MPDTDRLKQLQAAIHKTQLAVPGIEERAVQTGDFTEHRRARAVMQRLTQLAEAATAEQEAPVKPAVAPTPTPAPTPEPGPSLPPDRARLESIMGEITKPAPYVPIIDNGIEKKPSGSLRDFIDIEIPNAIKELGKLGGYFGGESGEPLKPPVPPLSQEHGSLPIRAEMPSGLSSVAPQQEEIPLTQEGMYPPMKAKSSPPPPQPSVYDIAPPETRPGDIPLTEEGLYPKMKEPSLPPTQERPGKGMHYLDEAGNLMFGVHGPGDTLVEAYAPVVAKAKELGETPQSILGGVEQTAASTPGYDDEKEFLRRVKLILGDRPQSTPLENFVTALAYGAGSLFSRWATDQWKVPLRLPNMSEDQRRFDQSRQQIALQMLTERGAERRQKATLESMMERQNKAMAGREKIAQIQAAGKAGRKTAQNDLKDASQYYDLLYKMDRTAAEPFEREIDSIVGEIKAADDTLRTRGVGTGIPGEYKYNPEDLTAHAAVVDPLNVKLKALRDRLAATIQAIRTQNPRQ